MTTTEFINILQRIATIATINPGEKLWLDIDLKTNEKKFSIDKSYFPSIIRMIYDQNHVDILNTIIDDIQYIRNNIYKFKDNEKEILKKKIPLIILGLENMKITYINKKECVIKLDEIINLLKKT